MDLKDLRTEIDEIDSEMLSLFIKRMEICRNVAAFKKENHLPVLQGGREDEIIKRIKELSPDELKDGAAVLFSNIMDISKSLQQKEISSDFFITPQKFNPSDDLKIGCQGVSGSNQEEACRNIFGDKPIRFFNTFADVFDAVDSGEIDCGVLPIQNSTAGSVSETYDLMRKYSFFISARTQVEIHHCLAAKNEIPLESITTVYSHVQALSQCSEFLRNNNLRKENYVNTAAAAKLCASSDEPIASICSEKCAEQYGLKILKKNIADVIPNYTRFICITKNFRMSEKPSSISVSLSIPNKKSSLYRLLTKFSVNNLDLEHIESKPVANGSFDVIFYLDFKGNIADKNTSSLLNELKNELSYFKFLGNYEDF